MQAMLIYYVHDNPSRYADLVLYQPFKVDTYFSLTMTYGISTSSSFASSAVISKMTFFWCSGTGFLLTCSTSLLILHIVSINSG
jgi:hypothetical protein